MPSYPNDTKKTRTLGGVLLPRSIQWTNQWNWHPLHRSSEVTVAGKMIIWERQLLNGRSIILTGDIDKGWWGPEKLDTIYAMAAAPRATYTFVWDTLSMDVIFDHTDGDAVDIQKVHPAYDYFYGTIKLLAV